MAFHQPTRLTMQRVARSVVEEQDTSGLSARSPQEQQPDETQTWVLFSPPTDVTTTSYLTEDEHSLDTPGRSRVSDLGSLNTVARSAQVVDHHDGPPSSVLSAAVESVNDDAELDSLDGHLPGFRSLPRSSQQALPVLPTHDGLGSFHLDHPVLGTEAQDQIYQFERFNPRRVRRRLNSFEETQFELEQSQVQEAEKRQRIESWRLEHSRIILEEVRRESRRRQRSKSSQASLQAESQFYPESEDMTWHEEDPDTHLEAPEESEGIIARITRKLLRDMLGIDDQILSVLIGEDLPDEEELSRTPRASEYGLESKSSETEESWQMKMLEKVSRELGMLVNQISKHPGAFATYSRIQHMPLPYAGLPVIPESADTRQRPVTPTPERPSEAAFPEFKPTIHNTSRAVDIPPQKSEGTTHEDVSMSNTFTKEEWEQDMDIKLVFRYLVSRFTSRSDPTIDNPRSVSMKPQDIAAKAARVRQHHPLISRSRPTERRGFKATSPGSPVALRHHSSCASQSSRRSARRSSVSSRHYWDIGASVGTGSLIASNGPMGSWGEI